MGCRPTLDATDVESTTASPLTPLLPASRRLTSNSSQFRLVNGRGQVQMLLTSHVAPSIDQCKSPNNGLTMMAHRCSRLRHRSRAAVPVVLPGRDEAKGGGDSLLTIIPAFVLHRDCQTQSLAGRWSTQRSMAVKAAMLLAVASIAGSPPRNVAGARPGAGAEKLSAWHRRHRWARCWCRLTGISS